MANKNKKEKEVSAAAETNEHTIWDSFWKLAKPEANETKKEESTFRWF